MHTRTPYLLSALGLLLCVAVTFGQDTNLENRINSLAEQMTLPEKVAMCLGGKDPRPRGLAGEFQGVPRLGVTNMWCSDGPRGPHFATAFPVGVAFGATWDPPLIEQAAAVMGQETRAVGATMLLGPGINIQRDPLGGRFFEYFTEDPFLNSRLTVAYVKGLQSQRVAACLKHFACNNREDNRNNYMSMVSQRALEEIYFPAFKAAVEEGHAWAVMTAANGMNDDFVSDSKTLLHDTLKGRWGFDGMVLTDWLGTRSTVKAAFAGLDVSMPYRPQSMFGQPLLAAATNGQVPESVLDDKVRRVLRTMGRVGLLDGIPPGQGGLLETPQHYALSRRVAEESLVLLKNEHQTLPLDMTRIHQLLIVGPNANQRFCLSGLGGSSWQESPFEITPLEGVRKLVGTNATVQFLSADDLGDFEVIPSSALAPIHGQRGFLAQYFSHGETKPAVTCVESGLNFMWEMRTPDVDKVKPGQFRAQFSGQLIPPVSGTYTLRVTVGGGSAWVGGAAPLAVADAMKGSPIATATVQLQAGQPFSISVKYYTANGDGACRLEWALPTNSGKLAVTYAKLAAAAKSADAVLVFAGIDNSLDTEGRDRTDMKFPDTQEALIKQLVAANPRTIVTLITGSPLEIGGWLDQVPAVLEAWYPGMEGGTAIANALFGQVNPSGKLPFTWPKHLADSPAHALGRETEDRVDYLEGVFVGYRYFDTRQVAPQFPFGYGLSYTAFAFEGLSVKPQGDAVVVRFAVRNTGTVAGAEVAQVYVRPPAGPVQRPMHELKGFKKVFLNPGEVQSVELELPRQAFAYFDEHQNEWVVPPGSYGIEVGDSSRNLPLLEKVAR